MDTVTITLPISKKVVVIRNYTTRADDKVANELLYAGVDATQSEGSQSIAFPIANVMASQEAYIPRLVQSIDDNTSNIMAQLDELQTKDYSAIEEAVNTIIEEHSPKATAEKTA